MCVLRGWIICVDGRSRYLYNLVGGFLRFLGAPSVQSCCTLLIHASYRVFVCGKLASDHLPIITTINTTQSYLQQHREHSQITRQQNRHNSPIDTEVAFSGTSPLTNIHTVNTIFTNMILQADITFQRENTHRIQASI